MALKLACESRIPIFSNSSGKIKHPVKGREDQSSKVEMGITPRLFAGCL